MAQNEEKILEKLNFATDNQSAWESLADMSLADGLTIVHKEMGELKELYDQDVCSHFVKCISLFLISLERCIEKHAELEGEIVCFFLSDALSNILSYAKDAVGGADGEEKYRQRLVYIHPLMDLVDVKEEDAKEMTGAAEASPEAAIPFPDEVQAEPEPLAEKPVEEDPGLKFTHPETKPAPSIPVETTETYLLFSHSEQSYALPVKYVTEIIEEKELNPLPGNNQHLLGILNLRGKPVAVTRFFEGDKDDIQGEKKRHIIIVEFEDIQTGFIVDEAHGIADFDQEELQSTDSMYGTGLTKEVSSIVKYNEKNTFVLNLKEMLHQEYAQHG